MSTSLPLLQDRADLPHIVSQIRLVRSLRPLAPGGQMAPDSATWGNGKGISAAKFTLFGQPSTFVNASACTEGGNQ
jgi:hypothetical protein